MTTKKRLTRDDKKKKKDSLTKKRAPKTPSYTLKERRFVELYEGSARDAARAAGYTGDDKTLNDTGNNLLRKKKIAEAIRFREMQSMLPEVATRQDRQRFWTMVMFDDSIAMRDRLKASELLGKSNADFIERHQVDVSHEKALDMLDDAPLVIEATLVDDRLITDGD